MIDLNFEHNKKLSTQFIYEIINDALQVAEDEGFLNSFLFQRALYVFAAATLYEDQTKNIMEKIPQFPQLWDELVENGVIDKLKQEYSEELDMLCAIGQEWFNEYDEHIHSSYAVVTAISNIVNNFTSNFQNQVNEFTANEDISKVIETAKEWGMDNANLEQAAKSESTLKLVSKDKTE